ncbi:amidohydrolase family protein [Auraticoccus monumenti]|uniref:L-fuconolactonase n=1 Tax=Auraticoccus monumenti TaxID=675864 RepID=A0A1G7A9H0_9ACTN|nr:amidohydrolase family protein [Auraticoccus monumenti]SDE11588.1 L-fuconolactonase [Auraticoccus monumenti]
MEVVDTHLHLWDPSVLDYPWLAGLGALEEPHRVERAAAAVPATASVVVQAESRPDQALAEVVWVEEQAAAGRPLGVDVVAVVAAAPVDSPGLADHLDRLAEHPLVTGVRRLLQAEPAGAVVGEAMADGLRLVGERGLTFDVCVRSDQLDEVTELVRRAPGTRCVLDHLGKPPLREPGSRESWARALETLAAASPDLVLKLSGLGAEADPDGPLAEQALWFLRRGVEVFGAGRCMIGSDWPVSAQGRGAGYDWTSWVALVREACAGASTEEWAAVSTGTARRTYLGGAA